jgi:hypothetical protein
MTVRTPSARGEGVDAVVDLVERYPAGDQRAEVELAGLGELEEAGEVPQHLGAAHRRPANRLLENTAAIAGSVIVSRGPACRPA